MDLPYKYKPRFYQEPLLRAMDSGYKRAVWVAHRRSGKDLTCLNYMIRQMFQRVGTYYYFFPTFKQARKVLWEGMRKDGMKFMDHFPKELIKRKKDNEMFLETINGSVFQLVGSNEVDRIVGTNPIGNGFSEYAMQDPRAWGYIRPILAENNGWAIFQSTPRGENHFYDLYEFAKNDPDWFTDKVDVLESKCIPLDVLEREKREILAQYGDLSLYRQEYLCDFSVPIAGAYYAKQIQQAEDDKRITTVPHESGLSVNTYWDLGMRDSTAIWFVQIVGKEIRLIDYYEGSGEALSHYVQELDRKGYTYGEHYLPHDVEVRELGTGKSRKEVLAKLGLRVRVVPKLPIEDGINVLRMIFNQLWFDKGRCKEGLNALKNYRKEYDDKNQKYKDRPLHDWSEHASSALRYFAVSYRDRSRNKGVQKMVKRRKPISRMTGY